MPTSATIGPITAASEYAGEVALSPITSASTNPIALAFNPSGGRASVVSLAMFPRSGCA